MTANATELIVEALPSQGLSARARGAVLVSLVGLLVAAAIVGASGASLVAGSGDDGVSHSVTATID